MLIDPRFRIKMTTFEKITVIIFCCLFMSVTNPGTGISKSELDKYNK
jgi:hypothetical protein